MKKKLLYLYRGRFHKGYWTKRKDENRMPIFEISGSIIVGYGCFFYIISEDEYNVGKIILMKSSKYYRCSAFGVIKEKKKISITPPDIKVNKIPDIFPFLRINYNRNIPNFIIYKILELKDYKEVYD